MHVTDTIPLIPGFQIASVDAGLRKKSAPDMCLLVADQPCAAAGVFTTNYTKAAPVLIDITRLESNPGAIRAVLINAACANACTGDVGLQNAERSTELVAVQIGCEQSQVMVMSTGVIGVQLPMDKIEAGIAGLSTGLSETGWQAASEAIMTTDTRPKRAFVEFSTDSGRAVIGGIAKGAGMIAPNMATLLSVVATDVQIAPDLLQQALKTCAESSFNRVVVDGDMSTNDTLLALASGRSGVVIDAANLDSFIQALSAVCESLARQVVQDGEGATKFITLEVSGARSDVEARQIGNAIATSALVKTAFYGGDANWGRIVAAAGRSGIAVDQRQFNLWYDEVQLVADGLPLDYDEGRANAIAGSKEITIRFTVGSGSGTATLWTCDLSHDYVSINGHYRT